jgi:GTP-binding protein
MQDDPILVEQCRKLFATPCRFMLSVAELTQLPSADLPEVAFAGRSNVGKSSLFNALFGQAKLAKTSSTPGRTQQLNYFNLADKLYLVDLPGYGFAKAPEHLVRQWQKTLFDYLRGRPNLRRVFLMVDSRHGLKQTDLSIMKMLDESAVCYQIVLTKTDKVSDKAVEALQAAIQKKLAEHPAAHQSVVATSSLKKSGLEQIRLELTALAEGHF